MSVSFSMEAWKIRGPNVVDERDGRYLRAPNRSLAARSTADSTQEGSNADRGWVGWMPVWVDVGKELAGAEETREAKADGKGTKEVERRWGEMGG